MPQQRDYIGKALGDALSQIGATFGTAMQERARLEAVKALQGKIHNTSDFTVSPAQPSPDGYPTIPQVGHVPRHPLDPRNTPDLTRLGELSPNALQTILATFGASQPTLMEVDAGGTVMNRNRMTGQTTYETVPGYNFKSSGQPTQLSRLQSELAEMRSADPNDPRIPQHEGMIRRLINGLPVTQLVLGQGGERIGWNPRTGTVTGGSGIYAPPTAEEKVAYRSLVGNLKSIDNIRSLAGRASVTGPVSGRARKLGTRFFSDKDAQELISTTGQLRTIIYGMSGKQINESEAEWLVKEILPSIELPDENFEARLNVLEGWLKRQKETMEATTPSFVAPPPGKKKGAFPPVQEEDGADLDAEIERLRKELGLGEGE